MRFVNNRTRKMKHYEVLLKKNSFFKRITPYVNKRLVVESLRKLRNSKKNYKQNTKKIKKKNSVLCTSPLSPSRAYSILRAFVIVAVEINTTDMKYRARSTIIRRKYFLAVEIFRSGTRSGRRRRSPVT